MSEDWIKLHILDLVVGGASSSSSSCLHPPPDFLLSVTASPACCLGAAPRIVVIARIMLIWNMPPLWAGLVLGCIRCRAPNLRIISTAQRSSDFLWKVISSDASPRPSRQPKSCNYKYKSSVYYPLRNIIIWIFKYFHLRKMYLYNVHNIEQQTRQYLSWEHAVFTMWQQ